MNTKGKRYSKEEKAEVLNFVKTYNEENGRGGVANATKHFNITAMTIKAWLDKAHYSKSSGRGSSNPSDSVFQKLANLHEEIKEKETELSELKVKFDKLKETADFS